MDNLQIYNAVRKPPQEALKSIGAGRLKGMTDINPMWRIKTLTEQFGVCGIGWKYTIDKQWLENGADGVVAAFVNISLYIKVDGQWSDAIPGNGGSTFVAKESKGFYSDDEAFKKALSDALSVACKALGVGADVYWNADATKYTRPQSVSEQAPKEQFKCSDCGSPITDYVINGQKWKAETWAKTTNKEFGKIICPACVKKARNNGNAQS